ncbi:MAG: hypothetical protein ACHQ7N_21215 [Candidatus Methylomirabilales bacterium]
MAGDKVGPLGDFESCLLHRVGQAVEAGEVPADPLTELQAEIEAAKETPQEGGEAAAIWQITNRVGISEERAAKAQAAIEAGSIVARQRLGRGIAEAWLTGHQETYRRRRRSGGT